MAEWLEIRIPLAPDAGDQPDPDEVAALAASELTAARAGTWIQDDAVVYWVPAERGEDELARARAVAADLAGRGVAVDADGVMAVPTAPESEWRDAWKRYFRTTRLTRQIVVVPSWDSHEPGADDLVVHLDPEQAFGTGAHASTQLVLDQMQGMRDGGTRARRVLDVGAGSGILAIAAVLMWPEATALAVDSDPEAVRTAAANAAKNRVSDRVESAGTPIGEIAERGDVVLANIQADVLRELAEPLAGRVTPGGHLVLSGLLTYQAEGVAGIYDRLPGMAIDRIRTSERDPEWSVVHLRRSADAP